MIPCFNEVGTIRTVVDAVRHCGVRTEIIVVDDGSSDGSAEILKQEIESVVARVIYHPTNRGKGAALRTGLAVVTGDIVVVQDADLEYDPKEFAKMMRPIVTGSADVVFGSRFAGSEAHRVLYFWHRVGNGVLTVLSNMFTNLNLTDMETGYKMFRRNVIQSISIEEDRFGFESEVTTKLSRMSVRIFEVGISYYGRTYADGKKVNWRDGIRALYCIFKYNLFR